MKKRDKYTNDIEAKERPSSPGETLKRDFLDPLGMTQQELAERLGITRVRINEVLLGKRGITPDTAMRLARFFDTSVAFWMDMQIKRDLWDVMKIYGEEYNKITPLKNTVKREE